MDRRRGIKTGHRLRIGIARNAGCELAEIAAQRGDGIDFHGDDPAIRGERHPSPGMMIPRLGIRQEGFRPGGRPFDRPPDQSGGPGHHRPFGEVDFETEPAAHIWRNDADLVFRLMQQIFGEPATEIMRDL